MNNLKPVSAPRTVYKYFKRVYSNKIFKFRDKSDKERTWDATDIWTSLNSEEREKVRLRFEKSKCRHEIEYAKYLSTLEPYLKKKHGRKRKSPTDYEAEMSGKRVYTDNGDSAAVHENEDVIDEGPIESQTPFHDSSQHKDYDNDTEASFPASIIEKPSAPPKCAKDLFIMTHEDKCEKEACENIWRVMPSQQRSRYLRATTLLKNEFLLKYTQYLDSLSNKNLAQLLREKNLEVPLN